MRQSSRKVDEYPSENYNSDPRYNLAYKRVKRIKGFYVHALVYVLINLFIIASSYKENLFGGRIFLSWQTFSTPLFWGIGLFAHGMSVFSRELFFGQNWEEKKIQQFMEKEKSEKWE